MAERSIKKRAEEFVREMQQHNGLEPVSLDSPAYHDMLAEWQCSADDGLLLDAAIRERLLEIGCPEGFGE